MNYEEFIESKILKAPNSGFEVGRHELNSKLFPFQKEIVKRALRMGKCAIFAETGLGKTFMQIEWANKVAQKNNKPVLILCPLSVSSQTIEEGKKFGIEVKRHPGGSVSGSKIFITNYEQINNVVSNDFAGIVLDESSILKDFNGVTKNKIIERFMNTPFKLPCSATPSPNDELELGNHAEFLNVCTSQDMRARYFTTDKSRNDGNKYRLKAHGVNKFYSWVNTWAIMIAKPSDIGPFEDSKYTLPPLNIVDRNVSVDMSDFDNGRLFKDKKVSATSFYRELRSTKEERIEEIRKIVCEEKPYESFLIWINSDADGDLLKSCIPDAIEVRGSHKTEVKEQRLSDFAQNKTRVLITKKKIAQYGLNFQYVKNANMIFASLDFSFEGTYQAIRRMYRFGQQNTVNVYLITIDSMTNVKKTIEEKERKFIQMRDKMISLINNNKMIEPEPKFKTVTNDRFSLSLGDSTELIKTLDDKSVDFSFFSPPFSNMYVFSDDIKDLSNCSGYDEFMTHFEFIVPELYRITKEGRMVAMHIRQTTTQKGKDGYYSIVDFRGDVIRLFQKYGFFFHAEVTIRKDPQTTAIRTKNHQLMWSTTKKNSLNNRPGLADYVIVMRKGKEVDLDTPVVRGIPFETWCKYAEPIWEDIEEGDTLKYRGARDRKDERHITATQRSVIKRLCMMYTNPGEICYTPYSGSGTDIVEFLKAECYAVGHELKESYFNHSLKEIDNVLQQEKQVTLF